MTSNKLTFTLVARKNLFCKDGVEWALNAEFDRHYSRHWTLKTWEGKTSPSPEVVEDTKKTILRAFEFYHSNLKIPRFDLKRFDGEVIDDTRKG